MQVEQVFPHIGCGSSNKCKDFNGLHTTEVMTHASEGDLVEQEIIISVRKLDAHA